MPEQVIQPGPFFSRLAAQGLSVELAPATLRSGCNCRVDDEDAARVSDASTL